MILQICEEDHGNISVQKWEHLQLRGCNTYRSRVLLVKLLELNICTGHSPQWRSRYIVCLIKGGALTKIYNLLQENHSYSFSFQKSSERDLTGTVTEELVMYF